MFMLVYPEDCYFSQSNDLSNQNEVGMIEHNLSTKLRVMMTFLYLIILLWILQKASKPLDFIFDMFKISCYYIWRSFLAVVTHWLAIFILSILVPAIVFSLDGEFHNIKAMLYSVLIKLFESNVRIFYFDFEKTPSFAESSRDVTPSFNCTG